MKVLWVADYSTKEHKGGAQQTNATMIEHGKNLGYDIDIALGGSMRRFGEELSGYDTIILNNITMWEKGAIETLVNSRECIRYEHDYWVARNYPELYRKVKHTIFLSPLHKETIEGMIGYKIENYSLIPSPVDVNSFEVKGEKEKNSVLWAGYFCEEKGTEEFLEYAQSNPQLKFYIAGWGEDLDKIEKFENIEYLGELKTKELAKQYQKCEHFYHRPVLKEPFGRTVIEAYLCGCNLLLNKDIGAVSWGWDFNDYPLIKQKVQSQSKFWKIIENEI